MGQVAGVGDVDVDVHVEEVALPVVHAQVDDVAAGLADDGADLAQHAGRVADGGGEAGPRVYSVKPTGPFEDDPNVTDKKFPGNPTRSYRSTAPLRIVGEITEWARLTPDELQMWRERLSALLWDERAEIIN